MRRLIPEKGADGRIRCVQNETIVMADARTRRSVYTLKGKRAVYTYTGSHVRTVVFGLITDDGLSFFKRCDKFTKNEFADFLREAHVQFDRPIMMILDRAPQHKAKISQETLKDLDGAVELEFLLPGCPDLNAIEKVWRQMKRAVLNIPYVTGAGMHEDIDRWRGSSGPRTGHRKVPLPDGLGPDLCRRTAWGTLRASFRIPGRTARTLPQTQHCRRLACILNSPHRILQRRRHICCMPE